MILKDDGYLPTFVNHDPADRALRASVSASSQIPGGEPQKVVNGTSRKLGEEQNAWISDGISENGETLTLQLDAAYNISEVDLTFDSNFAYPIRVTMSANRQAQQRIGVAPELVKDYDVILKKAGKEVGREQVRGNYQRHNVVKLTPAECDEIEIHFIATNGAPAFKVYEVRAY